MQRVGDIVTFDLTSDEDRGEVISVMPFIDLLAFVASLPQVAVVVCHDDRSWDALMPEFARLEEEHEVTVFHSLAGR